MSETIESDMGANVWKILVAPGDRVEEEATLMILEAMKMEIPILAEDAGTIVAVHVAEGDSVASGQPLVEFETA
ncbi:acetyl-CoA carboxylase biotin carboxyl carrier protein subunit [Rhodococcus sp. ACS1]|uniref:biotin carboxylase n=2 Tax=Rhodococcus TaxID=1827 RepID=A0AAX3YEB0_RHOOP|nr:MULTISPECIES: biotin/lipoyl-binding carrier protein [Rhodococcus]NHU41919.1 biotin/lipoyl-binding carrier protein [Rhodococcus sp. A14]MCZ4586740.1 biotin/lipoyl-binding carrier protein [Rhodococcus opacus]MDF3310093.1 biotin/lipoyl-binding carrier protein [Rhodococcus sp. T2V]MDV6243525.1 biotin/lipoyl-binding carrier protein [Rhodococcus opacus]PBC48359.1 acetyl-CoA carboxylase biotin carboxyl carrier protein subunit [Rhodococcus sp. ACS1]